MENISIQLTYLRLIRVNSEKKPHSLCASEWSFFVWFEQGLSMEQAAMDDVQQAESGINYGVM